MKENRNGTKDAVIVDTVFLLLSSNRIHLPKKSEGKREKWREKEEAAAGWLILAHSPGLGCQTAKNQSQPNYERVDRVGDVVGHKLQLCRGKFVRDIRVRSACC